MGPEGVTVAGLLATTSEVWREDERRTWWLVLAGRVRRRPNAAAPDAPWRDGPSPERSGWRERAATVHGEPVFAVDYVVCADCAQGWVEQPFTTPEYQRRGLARAALAQLRREHPGLSWHTLGGHLSDSRGFWLAVADDVAGGYRREPLCRHLEPR